MKRFRSQDATRSQDGTRSQDVSNVVNSPHINKFPDDIWHEIESNLLDKDISNLRMAQNERIPIQYRQSNDAFERLKTLDKTLITDELVLKALRFNFSAFAYAPQEMQERLLEPIIKRLLEHYGFLHAWCIYDKIVSSYLIDIHDIRGSIENKLVQADIEGAEKEIELKWNNKLDFSKITMLEIKSLVDEAYNKEYNYREKRVKAFQEKFPCVQYDVFLPVEAIVDKHLLHEWVQYTLGIWRPFIVKWHRHELQSYNILVSFSHLCNDIDAHVGTLRTIEDQVWFLNARITSLNEQLKVLPGVPRNMHFVANSPHIKTNTSCRRQQLLQKFNSIYPALHEDKQKQKSEEATSHKNKSWFRTQLDNIWTYSKSWLL